MFFPRLRRQAKWMFLFLALAMGLGFVAFGVGAGGVGIGDVFRDAAGGDGIPSVSDAEQRVAENPRDMEALRDLVTANQAANDTEGAIEALQRMVELRPRDADLLRELAGVYLTQSGEAAERAQLLQLRNAYLAPSTGVSGILELGGRPLDVDPITNAVTTSLEGEISAAFGEAQQASANAVSTFRRVVALSPRDPNVQLELAQAARQANDTATTISAYERFLELAPEDPTAPEVRRILRQLRGTAG
jgi:regulator of sirC expression with transglutaminase-like and TPR domain